MHACKTTIKKTRKHTITHATYKRNQSTPYKHKQPKNKKKPKLKTKPSNNKENQKLENQN